jgi:catechol 2,3-dioxygenase-like lactoylglutathione lyase family enzyme
MSNERAAGPYAMHHTSLTVSDLDRSLAFYRDVLELEVVMQQEKDRGYLAKITGYPDAHVRMAHLKPPGGEHRIELFQYLSPSGTRADVQPRNVGAPHICFLVEDIHATYDRLRSAGAQTFSQPIELESGVNKGGFSLYFRDPDGITMELFQPARR